MPLHVIGSGKTRKGANHEKDSTRFGNSRHAWLKRGDGAGSSRSQGRFWSRPRRRPDPRWVDRRQSLPRLWVRAWLRVLWRSLLRVLLPRLLPPGFPAAFLPAFFLGPTPHVSRRGHSPAALA